MRKLEVLPTRLQKLDFVEALVEEIFVVFDDFDANLPEHIASAHKTVCVKTGEPELHGAIAYHLASLEIQALNRLTEGSRAQVFQDLITACDDKNAQSVHSIEHGSLGATGSHHLQ